MYENLKKIAFARIEAAAEKTRGHILKPETSNDAVRRYITPHRVEQLESGAITHEKAVAIALAKVEKDTAKKKEKVTERIKYLETMPEVEAIDVFVEWVKSSTWGYCPKAYATVYTKRGIVCAESDRITGCGYDKCSTAVANALNAISEVRAVLARKAEQILASGVDVDISNVAYWGKILGYGAGYGTLPEFECGAGVSCFRSIFEVCGYTWRESGSRKSDVYTITREESR